MFISVEMNQIAHNSSFKQYGNFSKTFDKVLPTIEFQKFS